jgi:hypothetical protein
MLNVHVTDASASCVADDDGVGNADAVADAELEVVGALLGDAEPEGDEEADAVDDAEAEDTDDAEALELAIVLPLGDDDGEDDCVGCAESVAAAELDALALALREDAEEADADAEADALPL